MFKAGIHSKFLFTSKYQKNGSKHFFALNYTGIVHEKIITTEEITNCQIILDILLSQIT